MGPDAPDVRRAVVLGAARSGRAAAAALAARGAATRLYDAKPAAELEAFETRPNVETRFGGDARGLFDDVDLVVTSPGIPSDAPIAVEARAKAPRVFPEVELAFRLKQDALVFGVTGTNGKSTTTALLAALLSDAGYDAVACGNIGLPFSEAVDAPRRAGGRRAYVVELSSYQLERVVSFRCDAALLLNVSPDHLDRHKSFDAYLRAKARIFERQTASDLAIVGADDAAAGVVETPSRRARFSTTRPLDYGAWIAGGSFVVALDRPPRFFAARADLKLVGDHNAANAAAALIAAARFGATPESVKKTFAEFRALPHRCALVRTTRGVAWYDDSKATNVDAALRALSGFEGRRVFAILGGRPKGDDFKRLAPALDRRAKGALLVGEAADAIATALTEARCRTPFERCGTLARAVERAALSATEGDAVLLSPACASFDQFRDYEHRGDEFQRLVAELPEGRAAS